MGDISVARPIFYIVNACDDNVSEEESANSASCSHFVIMKFMSRRPKQTLTYSWKIEQASLCLLYCVSACVF